MKQFSALTRGVPRQTVGRLQARESCGWSGRPGRRGRRAGGSRQGLRSGSCGCRPRTAARRCGCSASSGGSADPAGAGGRRRPIDADSTNAASTIVTMTIIKSRRHIGSAPKPGVSTLFSRTRMAPPRSAGAPPDRPGSRPIHHSVERTGREPPDSVLARPSGRSAAAPPEDHAGLPSGVRQQVSGDEPVPATHTPVLRGLSLEDAVRSRNAGFTRPGDIRGAVHEPVAASDRVRSARRPLGSWSSGRP